VIRIVTGAICLALALAMPVQKNQGAGRADRRAIFGGAAGAIIGGAAGGCGGAAAGAIIGAATGAAPGRPDGTAPNRILLVQGPLLAARSGGNYHRVSRRYRG